MTVHTLYPGFVKIFYTGNGHAHIMTLPVLPVGTGSSITVTKNDGTNYADFATAVAAWTTIMKTALNTADEISRAEIWTIASPGADPVFQYADDTAVAGTNASAAAVWGQACLTHRTEGGGVQKLYLMEAVMALNIRDVAPLVAGVYKNISDWMIGANGWIRGRDFNEVISPIALTTKVNDALRKKYLL